MRRALAALGATLLSSAMGALGCAPPRYARIISNDDRACLPAKEIAPLPSLGQDPAPFDLPPLPASKSARPTGSASAATHRFERERSGSGEALHAVVAEEGQPALVVGDRGTALRRDPVSGWKVEATGTTENLLALSRAPALAGSKTGEVSKAASYLAVGSHGVALLRSPEGTWRSEDTGTHADLQALWKGTLAVGDGGVMVVRSPEGSWRAIPSRTTANLHAIGPCAEHLCAVGDGGVMVECAWPAGDPVCIPRKPPTSAALRVVTDELLILGDGVWLGIAPTGQSTPPYPPSEWAPWRFAGPSIPGGEPRAAATNRWAEPEMLVAGRRGSAWLVGNWTTNEQPVRRIELPYSVDFHAVAYERVDGFLVGDGGTIVKLALLGFRPATICLR